jgi:PAS domain S-box-containing protein
MKKKPAESEFLRRKAEELLKSSDMATGADTSEGYLHKLIHELNVHQVELELQNEELYQAMELAESARKKYTELYNFAPTGYFTLGNEGRIIESNPAGAGMLGKKPAEIHDQKFRRYVTKDSVAVFDHFLNRIFESQSPETCEVTLSAEAEQPDVKLTGIATLNRMQLLIVAVDITELKNKTEKLLQSERQMVEIQEIGNLGNYAFDIQADRWESSEVLDTIFGISSDFNRTFGGWTTIIHPDWQKVMADYFINEVVGRKVRFDKDYKIIRQNDGTERWVHGTGAVTFSPDNQPLSLIGSILDITDRKNAEEQVISKNAELTQLNASKDKFFSIIAHDLRGPLGGFLSLTEMLVDDLSSLRTSEILRMAEAMRRSAGSLFKLLENLLQWSQMERGKISYEPEPLFLKSIADECLDAERASAAAKNLSLEVEIPETISVFADRNMLRSILVNLISNAIKFTQSGGSIRISAYPMNPGEVHFEVTDTGIGMSEEMLSKLFSLHEQINRKGTEGEISTGLGLLLCRDFIQKHGGNIRVESQEGVGSRFLFTLPSGKG